MVEPVAGQPPSSVDERAGASDPGAASAAGASDPGAASAPAGTVETGTGRDAGRSPGLREALLVGELVVVAVLLAGAATYLLPGDLKDIVLRTPLLIVVLLVGTAAVLWTISRPGRSDG